MTVLFFSAHWKYISLFSRFHSCFWDVSCIIVAPLKIICWVVVFVFLTGFKICLWFIFYSFTMLSRYTFFKIYILVKVICVLIYFLIFRKFLPTISSDIAYALFFVSSPLRLWLYICWLLLWCSSLSWFFPLFCLPACASFWPMFHFNYFLFSSVQSSVKPTHWVFHFSHYVLSSRISICYFFK